LFETVVSQFTPLPYPSTDWTGKTVIVTGANIGLGLEAARHFVRLNAAKVILGCRDVEKGDAAKADIESTTNKTGVIEVWQLDLGSFENVKEFGKRAEKLDRLDAVVENAGVATRIFVQAEGYEQQITVNVISTFLLAILLLPTLRRTATKFNILPHLVIVSSDAHVATTFTARNAPSIFEALRGSDNMVDRYPDSKLLEIFVVRALAKELEASGKPLVVLNTLSPGLCKSNLFRHAAWPISWVLPISLFFLARTSEMGSRTLVASASAGEDTHGKYLVDCKVHAESKLVRSEEGAVIQQKVYAELSSILESIQPGVRRLI
jgi:retinol dehydrogenase-12